MSTKRAGEWLRSQNSFQTETYFQSRSCTSIAVTSGKGGVGKSSMALKMAKILAKKEKKVLLIDCDHNLSNLVVKLGLPRVTTLL